LQQHSSSFLQQSKGQQRRVEAHPLKGPAFTNGFGFGYSHFMLQAIITQ